MNVTREMVRKATERVGREIGGTVTHHYSAAESLVSSARYEAGWSQVLWEGDRLFCVPEALAEMAVGELRVREAELRRYDNEFDRGMFENIVVDVANRYNPPMEV